MNKNKLVALGLSIGITLTSFTGCAAFEEHKEINEKRDSVAVSMSEDSGVEFFKLKSMSTYQNEQGYFASFVGHYDTKQKAGWYGATYEGHKDYNITYQIDQAKFDELNKYKKNFSSVYSLTEDGLNVIQSVIDNYDVANVESIGDEDDLCK